VIFANPFVHHDEEHQSRTVRQARGRCVRIGQTRKVHVYHFMAPGTIEEQTLRHYSEYSKDVSDFFEKWELVPWWMDRMEKRTERSCGHS
jgi:Superfamily II DNA/RNA helicases, SNF2 family